MNETSQNRIGVNGSNCNVDDITYLNLELIAEIGFKFCLQYEPVLVSKHVKTNIYGIKIRVTGTVIQII